MKRILCIFVSLLLTVVFCTSCVTVSSNISIHYKNEEIEQDLLDEIKVLDDMFIKSITTNDLSTLNEMLSSEMQQFFESNESALASFNDMLNGSEYSYFDRYYLKTNTTGKDTNVAMFSENNEYVITINSKCEAFVSIILVPHGCIDTLLFIVYERSNDGWIVTSVSLGDYRFHGMNANDMFEKLIKLKEQGHLMSAFQYASCATILTRPAPFFQYVNEKEIKDEINELYSDLNNNYKFPYTLESSNVYLYGASCINTQQTILPIIQYITEIDLNDPDNVTAIEQEAYTIHDEVMNIFPGFEEDFALFLYKAYNEPPTDPNKMYHAYSTLVDMTTSN